jgi:phosphate transport system substrate-binding protein
MWNSLPLLVRGLLLVVPCSLLAVASCQNGSNHEAPTDTPTSGTVAVGIDETFAPILESQIDTFQKLYTSAHVRASYEPEEKVMLDLLNDKVKVVVVSRPLNADEQAELKKQEMLPYTDKIGIDGLAIILNPANPDSLLTMTQLRDIFSGKTTEWGQVSGKKALGAVNVVFDANRSSTSRFMRDSLLKGAPLSSKAFASQSNPALLEYVATHTNAIGVVGVNWISDRDDPVVMKYLSKIHVARITARPNPQPGDYIQPDQVYLAEKTPEMLAKYPELQNYPLRRTLYVISREARTGLGTGFVAFIAGKKGQLIFQKSGLMPAHMQARIVTTNKQ